jgi:hypothetical protein
MDALMSIAHSDSIALMTMNELEGELGEKEDFQDFKSGISVSSSGDLILITARAESPDQAAKIANEWASQAVKEINLAYTQGQPLDEIQAQRSDAETRYAASQTELEAHIQSSRDTALQAELNIARAVLVDLNQQAYQRMNYYITRKQEMEALAVQAQALKEQLENGSTSDAARLGDSLSILFARARSFDLKPPAPTDPSLKSNSLFSGSSTSTGAFSPGPDTGNLEINIGIDAISQLDANRVELASDVEQIIIQAQVEAEKAAEQIAALSSGLLTPEEQGQIDSVTNQVQSLEAALEKEKARTAELTSRRDLAWQTFQALSAKEAEIQSAASATNYTSLASRAVIPSRPTPRGTVRNTLIAAWLCVILYASCVVINALCLCHLV